MDREVGTSKRSSGALLGGALALWAGGWIASPALAGDARTYLAIDPEGGRLFTSRAWDYDVLFVDAATLTPATVVPIETTTGLAVSPGAVLYVAPRKRLYVAVESAVVVIDVPTGKRVGGIQLAGHTTALAVNADGSRVYAASYPSTVSVLDTASEKVIATLTVGDEPKALAIEPAGRRLFVLNESESVSVIDLARNAVIATLKVGGVPRGLAFDRAGKRLYVTLPGRIAVIDPAIPKIVNVGIAGGRPQGVAVDPQGERFFVANSDDGSISVFDAAKPLVGGVLQIGGSPSEVAFDPAGKHLFVTNGQIDQDTAEGLDPLGHSAYKPDHGEGLVVIDVTKPTPVVVARVPLPGLPGNLVFDPTRKRLYLGNVTTGQVMAVDTETFKLVATVENRAPTAVAFDPAAGFAYVADWNAGSVSVVDTAKRAVTARVSVGRHPSAIAVARTGSRAYVTNAGDGSVSVLDTALRRAIAAIPVGKRPVAIALDPAGRRAYVVGVVDGLSGQLSVIDTESRRVVARLPVGKSPGGLAVDPLGRRVYIANGGGPSVSVVDTATNTLVKTVQLPHSPPAPEGRDRTQGPRRIAVAPDGKRIYVTGASDAVWVIDAVSNTVTATLKVGEDPLGIAINPAGTRAFVTNHWNGKPSVSVIDLTRQVVLPAVGARAGLAEVAVSPYGQEIYVTNSKNDTLSVIDTATLAVVARIQE